MSDVRPVWLNREQRDQLYRINGGWVGAWTTLGEVVQAWDAAPADAAEAVSKGLHRDPQARWSDTDELVAFVLDALGHPEPSS